MKIVFIGTVEFSKKTLEKLVSLNAEIVGVFTKKASQFNADYADLKPFCDYNKIPCFFADNINDKENIEILKKLKPDIIFCFGWSQILGKEILNLTPMGVVGFHPAKLPFNRGRHPIIWALALGLNESASTFFFMDEGADSGDILSQISFEILYDDDAQSLYDKISDIAIEQIEDFFPRISIGDYIRIKQDHSKSNYWRKRNKNDGKIDFRMSSKSIYNLVRALTKPYVGAHLIYNNEDVKIWKVKEVLSNFPNLECGKILESSKDSLVVKCYDGAIKIIEHDFEELPQVGEYI